MYMLKVYYSQNGQKFNLDYLTSKFKANVDYPDKLKSEHLKPLKQKGYYIPNKKANVLENSWEVVEMAQSVSAMFSKLLKSENEDYLYRHYENGEGLFKNPIVEELGKNNHYIIELYDLSYPTYNSQGEKQKNTIEKQIYSFTLDASVFLPIKQNSFKPNLKSIYKGLTIKIGDKVVKGEGVISTICDHLASKKLKNRFDERTNLIDYYHHF